MNSCNPRSRTKKSSLQKKQALKLNIAQQKKRNYFQLFGFIKQGVFIHESCRIFLNTKTRAIKYVTFQDAKKGKIPMQDHHMVAAIDIDKITNKKKIRFWRQYRQKQMYLSIKNQNQKFPKSYPLNLGDTIKYVDCNFRVVVLKSNEINQEIDFRTKMKSFHFEKIVQTGICKICYGQQCQENDFFIRPCDCKGSVSAVHFSCLKKWIAPKIILLKDKNRIKTYSFKNFICQICKKQLPKAIVHKNIIHYLFDIKFIEDSYMILEEIDKQIWYIFKLRQGDISSVGNSPDQDITILSPFVKRHQSQIFYQNNTYRIRDMFSLYGCYLTMNTSCINLQFENFAQVIYENLVFSFSMDTEE